MIKRIKRWLAGEPEPPTSSTTSTEDPYPITLPAAPISQWHDLRIIRTHLLDGSIALEIRRVYYFDAKKQAIKGMSVLPHFMVASKPEEFLNHTNEILDAIERPMITAYKLGGSLD